MAGEPKEGMKICDPACGVGKFPLEFIKDKLDELFEIKNDKIIQKIEIVGFDKEFDELFNKSFTLKINSILGTLSDLKQDEYDLILTNPPYVMSGSSNLKKE